MGQQLPEQRSLIRYSFTLTSADLHGLTPELVIASMVSGSKVKDSQRSKIGR